MKRGLAGMGYLYASMCGTAVVQLKDIPPRPSEYDGRVIVFDKMYSEMTSEKDVVVADLERFGGTITEIAIKASEAQVTFATHEQAERCIAALREEGRGACTVYNETAYSRGPVGEPFESFSGWCTFEQGSSKLAAAHLNMASRQASKRSVVLPERLVRADASRAKVVDISDGKVCTVDVEESPVAVLKQTSDDLEIAKFVGKGEAETVKQLLAKVEWSMHMAMEQATADHVKSGLTIVRVRKFWSSGRGGTGICALLCDAARCLRGRKYLTDDMAPSQSCATGSISGSISNSPAILQHSYKAHRIVTV